MQLIPVALDLALANAGSNILAKIAMMAITTSSSIRVKPRCFSFVFIGNLRYPSRKICPIDEVVNQQTGC
jgi:hypothetical protein